jgi:hypothetical protein
MRVMTNSFVVAAPAVLPVQRAGQVGSVVFAVFSADYQVRPARALDQQRLTAGPMFVDGTAAEEEIPPDALFCR